MLNVYADETGTRGLKPGGKEPAPGVYGFIDAAEHWDVFRVRWACMLRKYNIDYFHFRELNRSERKKPKNPYFGWSDEKVDDFIHDMAIVASCGPIPFGGFAFVKGLYGGRTDKEAHLGTYKHVFEQFFQDVTDTLDSRFPGETSKVSFFFDKNENDDWITILNNVIKISRRRDQRIGDYVLVDANSDRGMPCQAADLLAYVNRQKFETTFERGEGQQTRLLDFITSRHGYPSDHPRSMYAKYTDKDWENLIKMLRADKKLKHTKDIAAGLPEQTYYPFEHHPLLRAHLLQMFRQNPKKFRFNDY